MDIDRALTNLPFNHFRSDGWPFCPNCDEDELISFLSWHADEPKPSVRKFIDAGMRCCHCLYIIPAAPDKWTRFLRPATLPALGQPWISARERLEADIVHQLREVLQKFNYAVLRAGLERAYFGDFYDE